MKIDGHCHCGQIEFEAEAAALRIRRRTNCQTLSGSAFRANVSVSAEHFKLLAGTPKRYVKTAESGNERLHAFCGNCGTPIYACAPAAPASYSLRIGTIKQRAAFTPGKQIWRRSALRWVDALASVPATEKESGAALPKLRVNFFTDAHREAPRTAAARLRLRFTGETPRGDFSVDFLSEKDNPCYGVFSVLEYGPTPFGIWRTRIWKMATAEPIAAGEADGRTESPGNGAATP